MVNQTKLDRIKKLLDILNDGVSKQEFINSFKAVMDHLLKLERQMIARVDGRTEKEEKKLAELRNDFYKLLDKARKDSDSTLGGFRRRTMEAINNLFTRNEVNKKLSRKLEEIDFKMAMVRDGKDADEKKIIKAVLDQIDIPEPEVILDTPEKIADKLETLKGEKKLSIDAIKDLEDRLKRLEERPLGGSGGGGGVSKLALDYHFIDDETPSGTVDGVNKTFTLANKPNPPASLKVYADGQRLNVTEDYTLSSKTITFIEAPVSNTILKVDYKI